MQGEGKKTQAKVHRPLNRLLFFVGYFSFEGKKNLNNFNWMKLSSGGHLCYDKNPEKNFEISYFYKN